MKKVLLKITPKFIKKIIRFVKLKINISVRNKKDRDIFSKNTFENPYNNSKINYRGKLTLYYHAIEKGLSHETPRLGFGKYAIEKLFETMDDYLIKGHNRFDYRLLSSFSVIKEYIELHNKYNYDVTNVKLRYDSMIKKYNINEESFCDKGGSKIVEKINNFINFEEFVKSRHSIRNFSLEEININSIEKAVEIASFTPSACNRQPWRVLIIRNDLIQKVLSIQNGLNSYGDNLHNLLLVTCSVSYYGNANERNAPYIDGGLFAMSLIYSLHSLNIATCALNSTMSLKNEYAMRKILEIPKDEVMIMFIALGKQPPKIKIPYSIRDDSKNIFSYKDK